MFSQRPGVDEGGDLGEFKLDQLNPALRKIIEDIPEGKFKTKSDLRTRKRIPVRFLTLIWIEYPLYEYNFNELCKIDDWQNIKSFVTNWTDLC